MFKAVTKQDFLKLGSLEDILRKSIIITSSKVKNFNLLYANIKIKLLTEELAKFLDVEEMEALERINITPEYMTLEDANLIASTKEYENFKSRLYYYSKDYEEIFENEAYSCFLEDENFYINFKGNKDLDKSEIGFGEGSANWFDELGVLKAFVTNSTVEEPSEALKYIQIKKTIEQIERYEGHFGRWDNWNKSHPLIEKVDGDGVKYWTHEGGEFNDPIYKPPLESEIYYNKENKNFICIIDRYHLVIIDKRTKSRVVIYNGRKEFLYKFCDYCLGVEPKEINTPEDLQEGA